MLYATRADLETRFNADEIAVLEQTVGDGGIQRALQDATEEVDSYIAVRYALPLPSIPAPLKVAVCDIARFRLYKDRPTEEVKYRYEKSVEWLNRVGKGAAVLAFTPPLSPAQEQTIVSPVTPVSGIVKAGVFGDDVMSQMTGWRL